jgi:predicted O-methyltransferase YrrM
MATITVDTARQRVGTVEGWLTEREGAALFQLARDYGKRGVVVEIGSWKERSTIWLATGLQAGGEGKVVAIDPHTGSNEHQIAEGVWTFDEFQRNVGEAGVADLVEPMVTTSVEAAKGFDRPVAVIFIDGAHEYEAVRDDFEAWYPKVIDGGMMAFNDSDSWPGVSRLVRERVVRGRNIRRLRLVDSTLIAQKVARNSPWDRMRNRYIYFLLRMSSRSRRMHLPRPLVRVGKGVLGFLQSPGRRE